MVLSDTVTLYFANDLLHLRGGPIEESSIEESPVEEAPAAEPIVEEDSSIGSLVVTKLSTTSILPGFKTNALTSL